MIPRESSHPLRAYSRESAPDQEVTEDFSEEGTLSRSSEGKTSYPGKRGGQGVCRGGGTRASVRLTEQGWSGRGQRTREVSLYD